MVTTADAELINLILGREMVAVVEWRVNGAIRASTDGISALERVKTFDKLEALPTPLSEVQKPKFARLPFMYLRDIHQTPPRPQSSYP